MPQRRRRNDLHRLDAYRCALELYRMVGRMVARFPRGEAELKGQMKRAARSVPFDIGEGVGKRGRARAAAYEVAQGEDKELIVAFDCVEIDGLTAGSRRPGWTIPLAWNPPTTGGRPSKRLSPPRTSPTGSRRCSPG